MIHLPILLAQAFMSAILIAAGLEAQGRIELGGLFSNTYLTCICAGGSCAGGLLYVIFNGLTLKTPESSLARASKGLASVILGMCFTPWMIHKFGFSEDSSSVLMLSTTVGFLGWSIALVAFPAVVTLCGKGLVNAIRRALNLPDVADKP